MKHPITVEIKVSWFTENPPITPDSHKKWLRQLQNFYGKGGVLAGKNLKNMIPKRAISNYPEKPIYPWDNFSESLLDLSSRTMGGGGGGAANRNSWYSRDISMPDKNGKNHEALPRISKLLILMSFLPQFLQHCYCIATETNDIIPSRVSIQMHTLMRVDKVLTNTDNGLCTLFKPIWISFGIISIIYMIFHTMIDRYLT